MLCAALALSAVAVAAAAPEPVAVAPWANLNRDASLHWLEQGAAETMAADLKRSGVSVVERAQIAEALAQVAAQTRDEVARAVAAGRIAGAKSIVLGSFQRAGSQIRLIARVVDVETGAVHDAAKATGPLDDIFALQDKIVAALARKPPPRRKQKPSVAAYEKLSAALDVTDERKKRALLEQALVLDPDFGYARDALGALEARMRSADDRALPALDARSQQLLAAVHDGKASVEHRQAAARALLDALQGARRFHALLAAADAVLAEKLPGDLVDDVNERASAARVIALARLVKVDLALQAGERHLGAFPAGNHRGDVEEVMHDLVEDRRSEPARRKEFAEELAGGAATSDALARDFHPCIAAKWSRLADEMLARCTRFLDVHAHDRNPDARDHVVNARAYVAWAHALKGDFAAARALARALEADAPGALESTGLRTVADRWSTD